MFISEFSRLTNTTPKTIRYYESIGLLPEAQRKGAYRVYDDTYVETVKQVKLAQELGFSLAEIRFWCEGCNIERGLPASIIHEALIRKRSEITEEITRLNIQQNKIDVLQELLKNSPCAVDSDL